MNYSKISLRFKICGVLKSSSAGIASAYAAEVQAACLGAGIGFLTTQYLLLAQIPLPDPVSITVETRLMSVTCRPPFALEQMSARKGLQLSAEHVVISKTPLETQFCNGG